MSGECAASAEALESAASRHVLRAGHSGVLRRVGRGRPALKTGLPVSVVDCPLVLVREHVVGLADLLELGLGLLLLVLVLIGVPLDRHFPVRLLQLVVVGVLVDAEDGVVVFLGRGHRGLEIGGSERRFSRDRRAAWVVSRGADGPRVVLTERLRTPCRDVRGYRFDARPGSWCRVVCVSRCVGALPSDDQKEDGFERRRAFLFSPSHPIFACSPPPSRASRRWPP